MQISAVAHICNPQETQGHPQLNSRFEASLGYTRLYIEEKERGEDMEERGEGEGREAEGGRGRKTFESGGRSPFFQAPTVKPDIAGLLLGFRERRQKTLPRWSSEATCSTSVALRSLDGNTG